MAIQNEPSRITTPFAASGTKNTIPDTQPSPSASQAASWTDGFPAQCSLPLSAGGIPPARADFNGIFNAITQSERFTQEGGVWLWSNAVDYAASRMVLGSDGKLYWSVAQSGPNVGGAVDPTADNGTYWVKLPSMADIAAQNYATQTWVRSLSSAIVYVNPNGNDSNDGLTQNTPVATFAKAVDICNSLPEDKHFISVAAGLYSGEVNLGNLTFILLLEGDVTLNDGLEISSGANVCITSAASNISPLLTIYNGQSQNCISVSTFAKLYTFVGFSLIGNSNASHLIDIYNYSCVILYLNSIGNMCSMTPNGISDYCISVSHSSGFISNIFIEATGNSISASGCISVNEASTAEITEGFVFASLECATPVIASDSSYIRFSCTSRNKGITFTCNSNNGAGCMVLRKSCVYFNDFWYIEANSKASGSVFTANNESTIFIETPSDNYIYVKVPSGVTCQSAFTAYVASQIFLFGSGNIVIDGDYVNILSATGGNSVFFIESSVTITGSASGNKVWAYYGSQFITGGRAIESLPGTTGAYNVNAASFAHYS